MSYCELVHATMNDVGRFRVLVITPERTFVRRVLMFYQCFVIGDVKYFSHIKISAIFMGSF